MLQVIYPSPETVSTKGISDLGVFLIWEICIDITD